MIDRGLGLQEIIMKGRNHGLRILFRVKLRWIVICMGNVLCFRIGGMTKTISR